MRPTTTAVTLTLSGGCGDLDCHVALAAWASALAVTSTNAKVQQRSVRDSQIIFSVTHGWSAFWRADHEEHMIGLGSRACAVVEAVSRPLRAQGAAAHVPALRDGVDWTRRRRPERAVRERAAACPGRARGGRDSLRRGTTPAAAASSVWLKPIFKRRLRNRSPMRSSRSFFVFIAAPSASPKRTPRSSLRFRRVR
jgi:hypothetical protein